MKEHYDKVLFVIGLVILLAGVGWYRLASRSDLSSIDSTFTLGNHPYPPLQPAPNPDTIRTWPDPPSQSWDAKAIFEVFTPPIIYYDKQNNLFTLDPPIPPKNEVFGVELVDIVRDRYRIQYEGFVGNEGNYLILLKNEETGNGVRGRVGQRFEKQQFSIVSFEVDRRMVRKDSTTPLIKEEIKLVIFDERLGEKVLLDKEPRYNPGVDAILRATLKPDKTFKLQKGEAFQLDGEKYTLQKIDLEIQSVTVEKEVLISEERLVKTLRRSQIISNPQTKQY